jgi:hypothetical protein
MAAAQDALSSAESLWKTARQGTLSDVQSLAAAELLGHDDPFVRALAEWAIAIRVQKDNGGQEVVWPRRDAPDWYRQWTSLDADALIDCDYARLGIQWEIYRDPHRLLSATDKAIERAAKAAGEVRAAGDADATAVVERQLRELASIRSEMAGHGPKIPHDLPFLRQQYIAARRAARPIVLANPAMDFEQLVFVKRHSAHSHRNITGSQYPWVHKPGGNVCIKSGFHPAGGVRGVIGGQLGPGHVHGLDLWWDADRVVFGYARQPDWPPPHDTIAGNDVFLLRGCQEPTHIYEIGLDGSGLRQVTNDPYWSDCEPTYTADGGIVFASDRSGRSSECGKFTADHTVINLYGVRPDGSSLPRRLSDNKDIDRYPHSLDNGMIGYTRWEYQERHFFEVHAFWQVRPDGTMADAVFNQHLRAPFSIRDTRSIPGSQKLVSIASGHHTFAYGAVVRIDPRVGISESRAMDVLTPHCPPQEGPLGGRTAPEGGLPDRDGLFQTPWALSETCYLVSYSHAQPPSGTGGGCNASGFSIYVIDAYGNKELIHRDPVHSCAFPIPLKRRPRPPVVPALANGNVSEAVCYVADVHEGLDGVDRGTIKHLRILQRVGWPLDDEVGAMRWIPGNAWERRFGFWSWAPVRVIGTVPVHADGSAHFKVPADTAVYFQALDEHHMEIRRMRSHISFQPGESRGCTGCHESQLNTPSADWNTPAALAGPPDVPEPPPWGADRLVGYERLVQPVFDRHCVRCHGGEKPAGDLALTSARTDDGFLQSFHALFDPPATAAARKKALPLVAVSNRFDGAAISQPLQFGSPKSRLIRVLIDDELHLSEVDLPDADWQALVTWVDANAPYYDTFYNRRPAGGDGPVRNVEARFDTPWNTPQN